MKKYILIIFAALLLTSCIPVRTINHRGYSDYAPENTLAAYQQSKLHGYKYVETDISFTHDGVAVLLHDNSVDRTSNGKGKISDLKYNDIARYDFGAWKDPRFKGERIPTLEEFLALCQKLHLRPYIEIKQGITAQQARHIVEQVAKYKLTSRATYISFQYSSLKHILTYRPDARIGYLVTKVTPDVIRQTIALRNGRNKVFIDASDYSAQAVALCKANKIPLEVWTIDDEKTMKSLNKYIKGVTSNSHKR